MGLYLSLKSAPKVLLAASLMLILGGSAGLAAGALFAHRSAVPQASQAAPVVATPQPEQVLLSDAFDGADRLMATSPVRPDGCATPQDIWEVTNGSLFIRQSVGYSGLPTEEQSHTNCPTSTTAGSHVFRMHSQQDDFENIKLSLDYKLEHHGGGGGVDNSYDGLHLWTRHESQYALYAISFARWDGTFAIKKKLPEQELQCPNPANDGCYNDLTRQVHRPDLIDTTAWHHAEVTSVTEGEMVNINLTIDGEKILSATDDGQTFGRIIHTGAIGVRGDNTEFSIKNLKVTKL